MGRIKLNEISGKRIGYALARRIADIPETFAWNARIGLAAENRARLERYRNKHADNIQTAHYPFNFDGLVKSQKVQDFE